MLRPEALQRLLSDGLTGLPSAPPAWSAQTSSTMQQEVCARSLSDRLFVLGIAQGSVRHMNQLWESVTSRARILYENLCVVFD